MIRINYYDDSESNYVTQQLKLAHFVNDSRIKDKYNELASFYIESETNLLNNDKVHSKGYLRLSEEISKLRFEVSYLEKNLCNIEDNKRNAVLLTKTKTAKMINSIQMIMRNDKQKISQLQKEIDKQRNDYFIQINDLKNEKEEMIKDYNQVISDLWQEIKLTEIQLFSSSSNTKHLNTLSILEYSNQERADSTFSINSLESTMYNSLDGNVDEYKAYLEMQSDEFFLNSDLEDTYHSINNLQNKIEKETLYMKELQNQLNEIEMLSSSYREEISNLTKQHNNFKNELNRMNQNQWKQIETSLFEVS